MKRILTFLFCLSLLIGCRKSGNSVSPIIGTWSLHPTTYSLYTNGVLTTSSTQSYPPSDYIAFNTGGTMESKTNGTLYTSSFTLEGDVLTFDNTNKAKVTQLTSNILIYYFKDSINPTQYRINTFSLYK
jgi:hypothetical protein